MHFPPAFVEEFTDYLGINAMCKFRLLDKLWNKIIEQKIYQVLYISGKNSLQLDNGMLKRHGRLFRILSIEPQEAVHRKTCTIRLVNWAKKGFESMSNIQCLRLKDIAVTPPIVQACLGMKHLKHLSIISNNYSPLDLGVLAPISHQLSSLFLNVIDYESLAQAVFPNLEILKVCCDEMIPFPERFQDYFPALKNLEVALDFETTCTIFEYDFVKGMVLKFGEHRDNDSTIHLTFACNSAPIKHGETLNMAYRRLKRMFAFHTKGFNPFAENLPRVQEAAFSSDYKHLLNLPATFAKAHSLSVEAEYLLGYLPLRKHMMAQRFKLSVRFLHVSINNFLSWVSQHFPFLTHLEINQPIDCVYWDGIFLSLQHFVSNTAHVQPLAKFIRQAPYLKEIRSTLSEEDTVLMSNAYPHIRFAHQPKFKVEQNYEIDSFRVLDPMRVYH
ncbi:hypothetical protein DSO57_1031666 [Entomophthora muscae]|uniref:Uncharacterized protein n=1 Tax=Entomophthora muscae TaxID=34485 RepID=A0ACC2SDM3_9FUNG|nr:hypothetical protein DSO57_1031666 [Entomophthora muscae]